MNKLIKLVGDINKKQFLVDFDYDPELVAMIKEVSGSRFDRDNVYWTFPTESLEQFHNLFNPVGYVVEPSALELVNTIKADKERLQRNIDRRMNDFLHWVKNDFTTITPYQHQIDGILKFLSIPDLKGLCKDDMGLGKTYLAMMIAKFLQDKYLPELKVIIVSPVSLQTGWERAGDTLGVNHLETFSYGSQPKSIEGQYFLIFDECHYLQTYDSQRSTQARSLADNSRLLLMLTGTPMRNGLPANIFNILHTIKHPIAQNKYKFEARYCEGQRVTIKGRSIWEAKGIANREELTEAMKSKVWGHKKEECLDLPPKNFVTVDCVPTKEDKKLSDDLSTTLWEAHRQRMSEKYDTEFELDDLRDEWGNLNPLVELGILRQCTGALKISRCIELVEDLLEEGKSVVVFTDFILTGQILADKFNVRLMSGQVPQKERQPIIDDFQNGISKVFVGTIKACGAGLTLTAASDMIFVDFPYTPGDFHQACDRIHRINQTKSCFIYQLVVNEIDKIQLAVLGQKSANIKATLDRVKVDLSQPLNNKFWQSVCDSLKKLPGIKKLIK